MSVLIVSLSSECLGESANIMDEVFRINPEFKILGCVESQPQNAELGRI